MIIFLDIDGVLNDHILVNGVCDCNGLKRECVNEFNRLIEIVKPKIVLSSAWRYMVLNLDVSLPGFKYLLQTHGVTKKLDLIGTIGYDGEDLGICRGRVIEQFIKEFDITEDFLILDDSPGDMSFEPYQNKLFKINGKIGLTKQNVDDIIWMLRK